MITQPKPFYCRRRYWAIAVLALLIYFCFVPSPLIISPQTTGITAPFTPDGKPDYFGAYRKTWIGKLSPPEDNGQRLMVAACGPVTLEQMGLVQEVPWEEMPTHEKSKKWFAECWIPLCENMYIDPYSKPKYYESRGFHDYFEQKQNIKFADSHKIFEELVAAPWKAEEHPDIAAWLAERSPVLDLFGVAVRKPNFVCWRPRPEDQSEYGNTLASLALPDVQANRTFSRDLQVRITERLGRGDTDGAWDDAVSMLHLSRHYLQEPIMVTKIVGAHAERLACQMILLILQYGNPTEEQLTRFADDLDHLPNRWSAAVFDMSLDWLMAYDLLHNDHKPMRWPSWFMSLSGDHNEPRKFNGYWLIGLYLERYLPIDKNIAGRRLNRIMQQHDWADNPVMRRYRSEKWIDAASYANSEQGFFRCLSAIPLIRTRSLLYADGLVKLVFFNDMFAISVINNSGTKCGLIRIAVALERFKKAHGGYPDDLEALVPKYLVEVPLDPCTGRKTLTYKKRPDADTAFLLYSFGYNGTDDGGVEDKTNPRTGDVVVKISGQ